ncbi:hypothetical protein M231_07518 [Tremella mesenterica]|uniref:Ribosome maturation protein SDO1/SBDS N-terminal domain-containing protein n=1 Tax=Tremella mesenterica TaxID=5217 RepID=A0A4Q1BE12_TREME|nr:hypothetical protein M231_07518 [Tremella mesenterica]
MPDKAARTVIYKPDPHGPEYLVFVDDVVEYERWKAGDRSIALALIIGKFAIYSAPKGHTGPLNEVSRQEIENVFFGGENNVKDKSVE